MNKPSAARIETEIGVLKIMKPTVVKESMFGDNHHDAIDAQIKVLKDGLTENDIYERYDDLLKDNVKDAMLEAAQWVEGECGEPSKEWKCLVRK
jgi:hypothetical protein